MRKSLLLFCFAWLSLTGLHAQIQYQWHKRIAAPGITNEVIDYVTFDGAGNVYVSGQNGAAVTTDIPIGFSSQFVDAKNGFIAKLDPAGNVIWVKNFTTSQTSGASLLISSMAVDDATGRIYFCGRTISGYVDLDPGAGVVTVGTNLGFIACLDKNGNYQWGGGFTNIPYVQSVRLRANGDPVFGATFNSFTGTNIDVDVSAAVVPMVVNNTGVRYGGFILMYSAAGAYQSFGQAAVTPTSNNIYMQGVSTQYNEDALVQDMEIDASGNIFLAVNSPWYTSNNVLQGKDMFLVKFNSAGAYQNHIKFFSTLHVNYNLNGIDLDAAGNVYAVGQFANTLDFDGSAATANLSACYVTTYAGFLAKYDNNLAYVSAVKLQSNLACASMTTAEQTYASDIAVSGSNVFVSGIFTGTTDFDPSAGNATATTTGGNDSYLAKYNTSLAYQSSFTWGSPLTTPNAETANRLDANASQELLVAGLMDGNIPDINPQAGTVPVALVGGQEGLVAKYYECSVAPAITTQPANVSVCLGASATFSVATTGTALNFQWRKGGTNIPGATSNQYTIASTVAGDAGSYDVVITNLCNATTLTSSAATLTINTAPTGSITGTNAICTGGSTTLTAPTGASYLWSNAATTASITVTPTANTTYTVTVTNASGCTATFSQAVTINALPTPAVTGTNIFCLGGSTTLTATGGVSYLWSNGATTAAITVTPTATTTYTVTATNASGCTATANRTVTIQPLPTVGISGNTSICVGNSTTLIATGSGTSFLWSNGSPAINLPIAPTATTTYSVTATGNNNCTASTSATVTVSPALVATITGPTVSCGATPITLTASGGGTYAWSNAATTAAITVSPTANTTYTVTVTNGGCTATASRAVTASVFPSPGITGTNVICAGTSTTLTGTGGGTYAWSNGATTTSITVSPATTTTYVVTVTNAAGCTASNTRTVTINPNPTPAITGPTSVCGSTPITLTASGGTSYAWSNAAATAAITVTPTANTTYTVTVTLMTNNYNCTATASQAVTVGAVPTAAVTGTNTICAGASTTLTATGGTTYTWSTGATTAALTVSPTTTTTYTVTVANAAGCTATATRTVTVNAAPTAAITGTNAICAGGSTTLTATGGGTYAWSNAATASAITVTPTATTTYTVTVTNANNCTATANTTVTVNALPTAAITGAATICAGGSTTLTATGGGTYAWSNAATTAAITVTPTATTTYTVTVTNANNCTATAAQLVTVNALPTAAISGPTSVCTGLSATLTASGGTGYLWSNGATTAAITLTPSSTTTYTVTVTNAANCTATASQTLSVNTTPVASISGSSAVCNGASTTLTANGGNSYTWSNGSTSNAITVSPTSNTTYTVTVSLGGTCTATASQAVTVNSNPTAAITGNTTVCAGVSTTLTATGGGTYAWSNSTSAAANTVTPTATTTYTVTVTNANNCTATANSTVTVNALPTAAVTGNNTLCAGETTTLTATGGGTYAWSNNTTTATNTVTPTATTTYTVTVTNTNNCSATANRTVTVNALPTAAVTGNTTLCAGVSTTLTATGGTTYAWSNGANTAAITVTPTASTTYTVTVTNAAACTATAGASVVVNALPTPVISGLSAICTGLSSTLTATGGTTYAWSNGANTAAITVSPASTTTYTVTVTNATACTATAAQTVQVNTTPTASITGANAVCDGASSTLTAAGGTTYAWSTGETSATINVTPTSTTTYTVTVSLGGTCTASATQGVTVNPNPVVSISGTTDVCPSNSTTLTATGGTSYAWSTNDLTPDITVTPATSTVYVVTATNAFACTGTASSSVSVLNPTVISTAAQQLVVCENSPLNLSVSATGSGTLTYAWTLNTQALANTSATYSDASLALNEAGSYEVAVSGTCGTSTATIATVTVNPVATATESATICQGDTYSFNGQTLSTAGTYTATLAAANTCDSIITLTLTVLNSPQTTLNESICQGANITFNGQTIGLAGTYTATFPAANGCDSTVTLNLTVNALPTPSITQTGAVLSTGTFATYQWFLNGTLIVGANAQTYTPTANGTYTVAVTNGSACAGQSTNFSVTNVGVDIINATGLSIYPNPTDGQVFLQGGMANTVEIFAVDGRLVQSELNVTSFNIAHLDAGMYMVRISTAQGTGTTRLVKVK